MRKSISLLAFAIFFNTHTIAISQQTNVQLKYNQIDATAFPIIKSFVNVLDNQGNSITGLDSSDFDVEEDGVGESALVEPLGSSGKGVNVALVLDRSGSMGSTEFTDLQTAATFFVNQMADSDKVAIVSFASTVTIDRPFTSDKAALISTINRLGTGGSTWLHSAIIAATQLTVEQPFPKALIVMCDGDNSDYSVTLDSVISYLQRSDIPCFTIGLGLNRGGVSERRLIQIADSTHGEYYYAPNSADLMNIYQSISTLVRMQYMITYTTHNAVRDGTWRNVQITVNYLGELASGMRQYLAPKDSISTIYISADSTVDAGDEFWLDIWIGDSAGLSILRNFFCASLRYDLGGYDLSFSPEL